MPERVSVSKKKLDNLANAVAVKSEVPVFMTIDEMTEAVLNIAPPKTDPVLQDKTVIPSIEQLVVAADDGFDGLGTVTVSGIQYDNGDTFLYGTGG